MGVGVLPWTKAGCDRGVVSVDWVAFSCKLTHPYDGRQFYLPAGWSSLDCTPTAVWGRRFFFVDEMGNKMATFLCSPRSPVIGATRAVVEIANWVLYRADYEQLCEAILQAFPMVVDGVNRVDLCCDFEMDMRKWTVVRAFEDGVAYLKGLRKGNIWWTSECGRRVPHQLSWGGKDSVFKWKLYWKYKELHEGGIESSKPYIEDMWRACGLEARNVWRLEVSIVSSNSLERVLGGGSVGVFSWYPSRVDYYRALYRDKFVVRYHDGGKNRRYDPIVEFLRLDGEKVFRHKSRGSGEYESDVERRVVCKMWKEFRDNEVRADAVLLGAIRSFLMEMCQYPRNVMCICRRFGLTETEVVDAIWQGD